MAFIQSVSRQQPRFDDVLKTGRRWDKRFDVIEVQDAEAPHYTQHTTEWKMLSKEQYDAFLVSREKAKEIVEETQSRWSDLTIDELVQMRVQLDGEISTRQLAPAPEAEEGDVQAASSLPVQFNPDDQNVAAAHAERTRKIIAAIEELDSNDPEDWARTPKNLPRVKRVEEIAGFKVSQADIEAAMLLSQKH